MKLKTSDLKSFKANSASIKPSTVLPILSYLKFEKNKVTKNSMESFIMQDMPGATPMLVDEKTLMAFVDKTKKEVIEITEKDGRVTITDGTYKAACAAEDIATYPVATEPGTDTVPIGDLLPDIKIAASFVDDNPTETNRSFIYIGRNRVSATDANIMYYKKVSFEPEIILEKETAIAISKFPNADFSQTESYHFFTTEKCTYGFRKPEMGFFDMSVVIVKDYNKMPMMEVSKSSIVEFNEMCISMCPAKLWITDMDAEKDNVSLTFVDKDFEQTNEVKIPAEVNNEHEKFRYNCVLFNRLLKSLPDEQLSFYRYNRGQNSMYFIEGLGGYTAVIIGIVLN